MAIEGELEMSRQKSNGIHSTNSQHKLVNHKSTSFRSKAGSYDTAESNKTYKIGTNSKWNKQTNDTSSIDSIDDAKRKERERKFATKPKASYGFISRGEDSRLSKSESARKRFFQEILASFLQYCDQNSAIELNKYFASLISSQKLEPSANTDSSKSPSIESILASLRKLREALLHLPCDEFTVKVYLFSIRIAANFGHYQTYIPSIIYLLRQKIAVQDIQEIATLLVLHTSHFSNNNAHALQYLYQYAPHDMKLRQIVSSWISKDYYNWVRLYNLENDNSRSSIMKFGLRTIMVQLIQCVSVSYFNLKLSDLTQLLPKGVSFKVLQEDYSVDWVLEVDNIIIRKRK